MKNAVKSISVVMVLLMCILCFAGCGNDSSNDSSNDGDSGKQITTSSQAISEVKNYMSGTSFSLEQRIAGALGFNNFYDPQYGTSSATQNRDGSWDVTIKGSMSGYVDEYHDDFESYKFEVSATVSESGSVLISVSKVY